MIKHNWGIWAVLAALAGLFCAGMLRLARLPSGTSYPAYSSLGTGAFGTDLLFQALNRTGKVSATRNYLPLDQLSVRNTDLLYLGVHPTYLGAAEDPFFARLEHIAKQGNRVVLGVITGQMDFGNSSFAEEPLIRKSSDRDQKNSGNRWNIRVRKHSSNKNRKSDYAIEPGKEWLALSSGSAWERHFGRGSVVLVANVNRFVNRDLARDENARRMVPVLVGERKIVIFDESHLGVEETGSIAALAERYRLGGLMTGLMVVAGLFLWKNAVRFPPAAVDEMQTETLVIARADSRSILAGLLQRHVARDSLIELCVAEWNRVRPDQRLEAQDWKRQDPVAAYHSIAERWGQKKNGYR